MNTPLPSSRHLELSGSTLPSTPCFHSSSFEVLESKDGAIAVASALPGHHEGSWRTVKQEPTQSSSRNLEAKCYLDVWKAFAPVVVAHTIGHVAAASQGECSICQFASSRWILLKDKVGFKCYRLQNRKPNKSFPVPKT